MSDSATPMPRAYEPKEIEPSWYARWEAAALFVADPASRKPRYSIAVPPPNVTGELHMGHALNGTLQDLWARYRRMTGYEVLWLPGYDHAAIATQNVIEKQLARDGTSKEEIGREAFDRLVKAWYEEVGGTIIAQFRELGASLDWTRLRFTMDEGYVRAVQTAFVHLWEKGWLYRGPRIVNWCPRCLSAISDLEVKWEEQEDRLYFVRYELLGGGEVTIATVRPETMLADTGVAVHPEDPRYLSLPGREAVLPLVGRRLPVVADEAVEQGFGTGALKVTPGHDALDHEIGRRHGLEVISAIAPDGTMDVPALPRYHGLTTAAARELVASDLEKGGFLVRSEPYRHEVGHCDRCESVVEPLVSEQWWLDMGELSRRALEASRRGEIRWHPERYERTYLDWLRGLKDWCVSRQLWLGHRIPVFTCPNGHTFAAVDPDRCRECGAGPLEQDPDVLDTWFSSALWPFATLGWPEKTAALGSFYPTDLNSTARDIINLWVSRMIMTGLEFMGEVPFADVAIHCTVQAPDGRRMSKSLGTGVDPRDIIDRYGADALRAWSAQVAMSSQDVRFDETRIEGFRRFANKLWNATRLVLSSLGAEPVARPSADADLSLADRWILSRLEAAVAATTAGIEGFAFQSAIDAAYEFTWHELCDWYLEAAKPRLRDGDPAARAVALHTLDVVLRLLHPFMPFVSEELWHRLPGPRDHLVRESWPEPDERFLDRRAEAEMEGLVAVVEEIRSARRSVGAPPRGGRLVVRNLGEDQRAVLEPMAAVEVAAEPAADGIVLARMSATVEFPATPETGGRQAAEAGRLHSELARAQAKLANPDFTGKAPEAVVERERAKAAELHEALRRLGRA
ncbi:MAG: valine--tRNA ligase [Candidatus Dormibacterales bacterium]